MILSRVSVLQGAEHLHEIKKQQDVALQWIDQAEELMNTTSEWNEQFYPRDYVKGHVYWTKAKLLAASLEFAKALEYSKLMRGLENILFYEREQEVEKIDEMIQIWLNQLEKN